MIDKILKNRKHVMEYDNTVDIPVTLINSLLERTWAVTPSKNNFMPYNVFVIGPRQQHFKDVVYNICTSKDWEFDWKNPEEGPKNPPLANILNCSYLFIFTLRLEDQPTGQHRRQMQGGAVFEAVDEKLIDNIYPTASLEVGLFTNTLSALCLENDIDTSFISCFHRKLEYWKDLPFITRKPIILMTAGKGKKYRREFLAERYITDDLKPNYERIVKFI